MSRLITITGPAYSGKTTLIKHLKENHNYVTPRHITTRKKRIDDEPEFYRYLMELKKSRGNLFFSNIDRIKKLY